MEKKYESPEVAVMEVEVESNVLTTSPGGEMDIDPNNPSTDFGE